MSTAPETGATFQVINSKGSVLFSGNVGQLLGTWSHSKTLAYSVYALDFTVPAGNICEIKVSGPVPAVSPKFAVDRQKTLYSGLLLNTLFFYETERDGKNFVRNALRTAPGHLKDVHARFYLTPALDSNDFIKNVPPKDPLIRAKLPIAAQFLGCLVGNGRGNRHAASNKGLQKIGRGSRGKGVNSPRER